MIYILYVGQLLVFSLFNASWIPRWLDNTLSLSSDELDADEAEGEEARLLLGGVDERGDDGRRPLPQEVLLLLGHVLLYVFLHSALQLLLDVWPLTQELLQVFLQGELHVRLDVVVVRVLDRHRRGRSDRRGGDQKDQVAWHGEVAGVPDETAPM